MEKTLEQEIKERFEKGNFDINDGVVERMQTRIENLENAVSHLMNFIADRMRLTEIEINGENGLTDF